MRKRSLPSTRSSRPLRKAALVGLAGLVAAVSAGCGAVGRVTSGDPVAGKKLFQAKCGSCHTLADAGTTGTIGPNLDEAFAADKSKIFRSAGTVQTIRDLVRGQIAYPESDPGTGHPGMTPNLLHGQQARDVAFYVAQCAAVEKCALSSNADAG